MRTEGIPTGFNHNLFESERRCRLLVEGISDYAIYMLDANGFITTWNAGARRIKGYEAAEAIGEHFSKFYTPEHRAVGLPTKSLTAAATDGRFEAEGWRVRKDGTRFLASVAIAPLYEHGELIGFAKITRDITEQRNAQLALEKTQRQLAESQKLDALGQLTGGVAHDFNNLLMIVSGHLQCVKRATADDPRAQRAVQAIEMAAQRGAALTRQLLTFARRQRVNPTAIDVAERIEAVRDLLDSGASGEVEMLIEVAPGLWPIRVDTGEFEIALINLVVNARDAMTADGTVTLSARNVRPDDAPLYDDGVAITIEDTGVGIPNDVLDRIFDPFFTTKPAGKSSGLGLSQVHGFIHQAGGAVRVRSVLGRGTAITMYFPRAIDGEAGRNEAAMPVNVAAGGGVVLLVEDNPEVAGASTELLMQLGYDVRWAPDAATALKELERDGVDLVFSDIVMPGAMDGIELARIIRKKHPHLPILLATGYSEMAQSVSADLPILRKPYQIHELSRALASLTRRRVAGALERVVDAVSQQR